MSGQGNSKGGPGTSGSGATGKPTTPSLRMTPLPGSPTGRLPSFKPPRDLTLGTSRPPVAGPAGRGIRGVTGVVDPNKKKFVPNLNVQRRDKSDAAQVKTEIKQEPGSHQRQPFQRGGGAAGRGRGANRPELIQTIGSVFSDGMGADGAIRRRGGFGGGGGGDGGGGGGGLERPKINLKSLDQKFDRAAEEERLKELMRDDFIDDLTTGNLVPVQLPMIDTGKVFKEEVKKEEDEDEDDLRIMRGGKNKIKKLNVILDSDDDDDEVKKPEVNNGVEAEKGKKEPGSKSVIKNAIKVEKPELTFSDLIRGQNGDLLFIQLPDHLPGTVAAVKDEKPQTGIPASDQPKLHCSLENLPEGYLGKIQIRASGRTQLLIGDMAMDVNFGTQVGFLQELVSINVPPQQQQPGDPPGTRATGDMSVLGRVRHRLVVTPDWNKLFNIESSPDLDSSDNDDGDEVLPT